ncbi:MAG TPA: tripeptide aminopeptidase PepT, partial [Mangrovimonas sp.]|nr:tripeptide aminopeptidase PepT [Mangrovimonas sp.]
AGAKVTVKGKSVHPGYAKGKLVNSMYIATDFINSLPRLETPEHTEEYQGFFHLHHMDGDVEQTTLQYIIRDHDRAHFEARKEVMQKLTNDINAEYGREVISIEIKDQYFNMREKVEPVMHIVDIAEEAMKQLDIEPLIKAIRGGTDGSQLSYMGLPCPNIFAGGHNFHGRYEYVPVESILKATEVICKIAELTAEKYS